MIIETVLAMTLRLRVRLYLALVCLLPCITSTSPLRADHSGSENATPVLVELFTSEGCSSCPPADALLQRLEQTQPVPGVKIIALSEHVDYWNHDGWTDPFSSSDFTERQKQYVNRFKLPSGYTPEMVVDGTQEFTGNDSARAEAAIGQARQAHKIAIDISAVKSNGREISLHLASPVLSGAVPKSLDVFVVAASPEETTQVRAGENGGKTLRHIDVVLSMKRVASLHRGEVFARDVTMKAPSVSGREIVVVAILQDSSTGKVWGAASARATD